MIAAGLLVAMASSALDAGASATSNDAAIVASAFDGRRLQLEMRGQRVAVDAAAEAAEDGCATRIIAQAPGGSRRWSRILRWSELAWAGTTAEGFTQAAFYDFEGHLATDLVAFQPPDAVGFRQALARLVNSCRERRGYATRVQISEGNRTRACFLATQPGIQIVAARPDTTSPPPPRVVIDLYSRETARVELQLFFEGTGGEAWQNPEIAFVVAEPGLIGGNVDRANFQIDGKEIANRHSIAAFGSTRLRITLDPRDSDFAAFASALSSSRELTLSLWKRDGSAAGIYTFEPNPALSRGRDLLMRGDYSCDGALPPEARAANWQAVD